jgi:hypothetical protein
MESQIERQEPRISLNKLGEYLTATPARRRAIVQQQKNPTTFRVARYREAYAAIVDCSLAGFDTTLLEKAMDNLSRAGGSESELQRAQNCREAISHFASMAAELPFDDVSLGKPAGNLPTLALGGVDISVRPELLSSGTVGRPTRPCSGAIKLYFSKTYPLTIEAAQYVGAVTMKFMTDSLSPVSPVDYRMVWVVDVFAEQVFQAPKNTARKIDDAVAACEEIVGRWNLH